MNGFEVCFNFVVSFHTFIISQYFKLCVWGGGGGVSVNHILTIIKVQCFIT